MKTLGLIGGTSWTTTMEYYKTINQQINQQLGGLNSAKLILHSLNFEEVKFPSDPNHWTAITTMLSDISKQLENAGAECIVLCANTPHMVASVIQQKIHVPLIHIAEETAKAIAKQKIKTIGLLGTKFTMEQPFFKEKLSAYGITTLIPEADEREFIHSSIFTELGKGIFTKATKARYLTIMETLSKKGAEGIVFGCTEIPLLIQQEDCNIQTFDTTLIHATAAVNFTLGSF